MQITAPIEYFSPFQRQYMSEMHAVSERLSAEVSLLGSTGSTLVIGLSDDMEISFSVNDGCGSRRSICCARTKVNLQSGPLHVILLCLSALQGGPHFRQGSHGFVEIECRRAARK